MLTSNETQKNAHRAALVQRAADRLAGQLDGHGDRANLERLSRLQAATKNLQIQSDRVQDRESGPGTAQDPEKPAVRVAVIGGDSNSDKHRNTTYQTLEAVRRAAGNSPVEILHASEIDYKTPTRMWASMYRQERTQYSADWEADGAKAAYQRDERLMNEGNPDIVICLPDANPKAVEHMNRLADKKGTMCHGDGETPPKASDIDISVTQAIADRIQRAKYQPSQAQTRTDVSGPKPLIAPKIRKPPPEWPRATEMAPAPAGADMNAEPRELTIVVTGTRRPTSEDRICQALDNVVERADGPVRIVHGNEPGVDTVAEQWAIDNAMESDVYPANWEEEGRTAGTDRNYLMMREAQPDMVLAFPEGNTPGTQQIIKLAQLEGVPVEKVIQTGRTQTPDQQYVNLAAVARTPYPAHQKPGEQPAQASGPEQAPGEANSAPVVRPIVRGQSPGTISPSLADSLSH